MVRTGDLERALVRLADELRVMEAVLGVRVCADARRALDDAVAALLGVKRERARARLTAIEGGA